jgi:hypothetical protein
VGCLFDCSRNLALKTLLQTVTESPGWDERLSMLMVVWQQEAEVMKIAAIKKLILFMKGNFTIQRCVFF